MYPNLYYAIKDWFGWKINAFKIFYTFGIFVALAFIAAAYFLTLELKRREKSGLLQPREENITAGKPASFLICCLMELQDLLSGINLLAFLLRAVRRVWICRIIFFHIRESYRRYYTCRAFYLF